ncbi:MAG: hypothetical protein O3A55_06575 [Bacteroidetes bacterium]|nr:hypothetical protein [Bacteroidota bacterium]
MKFRFIILFILSFLGTVTSAEKVKQSILRLKNNQSTIEFLNPSKVWGVDILLSNGGFGIGGFFAQPLNSDYTFTASMTFNEAKDEGEVEYYDYWGQIIIPGKINRFLVVPIYAGMQKRLFSEDIVDNFRPYINFSVGPTMIFTTNYNKEFFSSLGEGRSHWTFGGYIGIGANFGKITSSLSGVNLRYYFIPFRSGIPSMKSEDNVISKLKEFGGFFITLNFGKGY